jgi:hypothetical protein
MESRLSLGLICSLRGARLDPAIEIAFVPGARRKRLASLIFTNQLLEPVMSDQFGNREEVTRKK